MENEKILANGNSNVQKTKPTKQHIEVCVFDSIYYSHYYKTAIVYQALDFLPQFLHCIIIRQKLTRFHKARTNRGHQVTEKKITGKSSSNLASEQK